MKNILFLLMLLTPFVSNADSLFCSGLEITLRLTEGRSIGDPNFVAIQAWNREYDNARIPDLFHGAKNTTLSAILKKSSLQASDYSGKLFFDFKTLNITIETSSGSTITDTLQCSKVQKSAPIVFRDLGG